MLGFSVDFKHNPLIEQPSGVAATETEKADLWEK